MTKNDLAIRSRDRSSLTWIRQEDYQLMVSCRLFSSVVFPWLLFALGFSGRCVYLLIDSIQHNKEHPIIVVGLVALFLWYLVIGNSFEKIELIVKGDPLAIFLAV